jgi:AraC-like DNA-binding protein
MVSFYEGRKHMGYPSLDDKKLLDSTETSFHSYKLPIGDFIAESVLCTFLDLLSSTGNVPTCIREPLEKNPLWSKNGIIPPIGCQEYRYCSANVCNGFFDNAIKKSTFERPYVCVCPGKLWFIIHPLIINKGSSAGALISGYFHLEDNQMVERSQINSSFTMSEKKLRSFAEFHKRTAEYLMQYGAISNNRFDDCMYKNLSIARHILSDMDDILNRGVDLMKGEEWERERSILDCIALGKGKEAEEKVDEFLSYLDAKYENDRQEFKGRVMELAVVITRTPYFINYAKKELFTIRIPEFYPPKGYDLYTLRLWLSKILQKVIDSSTPCTPTNDAANIARMAIGYIDSHKESISRLEEVAHAMGFSLRHLNRIFLEEIGISASEYFVRIKIQDAKHLLHHTQLSIAEIAERLNYWDSTHFAKMFKKIVGKSPREFRQEGAHSLDSLS